MGLAVRRLLEAELAHVRPLARLAAAALERGRWLGHILASDLNIEIESTEEQEKAQQLIPDDNHQKNGDANWKGKLNLDLAKLTAQVNLLTCPPDMIGSTKPHLDSSLRESMSNVSFNTRSQASKTPVVMETIQPKFKRQSND